ncbi:MAG: hypothetical protein EU533_04340 [Promethearchaeota archaeon]|nr:MAG: hypothetical protein EU533_04340 [Candidatus Lokiarchaeota archaeon]
MKISNEMTLFNVIIDKEFKDLLLVHIADLRTAHIKLKSVEGIEKPDEAEDEFKEKIKDLRTSLNELFDKLEIHESDFTTLKSTKYEKLDFEAKDLNELISHLLEEINFYSNRVNELEKYIAKAKFALEELINLKISYIFLMQYDLTRESLSNLTQLNFRVYTTFTKNIQYLHTIFDFSELPNITQSQAISNDRTAFFIIYPKDLENILKEKIGFLHAEEVPILKKYLTPEGINFQRINKESDYIRESLDKYETEFKRIRDDNLLKFAAMNEVVNNLEEYNWAKNQFEDLRSKRLQIKFFVPVFEKEEVKQKLGQIFKSNVIIDSLDIGKKGIIDEETTLPEHVSKKELPKERDGYFSEEEKERKEKESAKIRAQTPTMMKHNRLFRPFETLTRMYGTPSYSEIDPTPFLFITFPLLFGIMFGDIGHGLILAISGLVGSHVFKQRGGDIYNFCWIIFWCGLWAIGGGILYGEFFGTEEILGYTLEPVSIPLPFIGSITFNDPLTNVMNIFMLTLFIGILHINLGWILQFINFWKDKKRYKALTESLTKMCFLDGGIFLLILWGFNINSWINPDPVIIIPPILLVLIPGLMLILFKPLGKAIGISYMKHESYGALIGEGSMETFETVLSVPSNVLSYIRLLALLLAHVSLMVAIQAMVRIIPGQALWYVQIIIVVGLIFGNIVVILLEGVLVFLNAIRLHFYEFFFKFYEGLGTEFLPFVLEENYSNMKFQLATSKDFISTEIEKEIETKKSKDEIDKARKFISKEFF